MAFNITDFNNKWANFKEDLKGYFNNRVVDKNGDTMTGSLILSKNPEASMEAVTKEYVDSYKPPWTVESPLKSLAKENFYTSVNTSTYSENPTTNEKSFIAINSGEVYMDFSGKGDKYAKNSSNASVYVNDSLICTIDGLGNTGSGGAGSNSDRRVVTLNKGDVIKVVVNVFKRNNTSDSAYVSASLSMYAHIDTPYTYGDSYSGRDFEEV